MPDLNTLKTIKKNTPTINDQQDNTFKKWMSKILFISTHQFKLWGKDDLTLRIFNISLSTKLIIIQKQNTRFRRAQ